MGKRLTISYIIEMNAQMHIENLVYSLEKMKCKRKYGRNLIKHTPFLRCFGMKAKEKNRRRNCSSNIICVDAFRNQAIFHRLLWILSKPKQTRKETHKLNSYLSAFDQSFMFIFSSTWRTKSNFYFLIIFGCNENRKTKIRATALPKIAAHKRKKNFCFISMLFSLCIW